MNNIRYIKPVSKDSYASGGSKEVSMIKLANFSGYDFDSQYGKVYYELYAINKQTTDKGLPLEYIELVTFGEVELSQDIANAWGPDDEMIFDYVLQQLGLEKL